ncbi:restriction endonuclease subunit S [Rhizobium laguerreae]|uniref:restriction endonuclease subunit S n=1 Tax=Rhizobium laguerreae TaxID=1076926 RepID=UPI001C916373|nr:restriction endonuclease subunit S [Rhizobium laguerreae]MBY3565694.1 restriction endonuclease subunit S [Rhizobium laguerreae]
MVEWRESTWGAEISLEYGKGIRGYADAVGPYRVFGSNGPVGWTNEPLAPGPGVILGRKGAYRGVQFSKEPFFVIDTAYYVVPKSEMDMRWLYYAIIHHKLGEIDDGSPIPSTTRAAVYVRDLSVPRLAEQEAIASILGALDDKIELNRRMNETLEATARAIFKDWFVDFGPTRAKMEGRAPYLASNIWSLFPDRLDDEGKPEGWIRDPLGAHILNLDSKRIPVSGSDRAKRQGPFPYHGATGVMDHVDDYLFDGVHLLVGEDGSVVKENGLAFTQYVWGRIWVNNHAHVLQGKGSVSTEQLLLYFQHETVTPYITGAVQLKLSQGRMNAMPFLYAGTDICEAFSATVAHFFAKYRANADENKMLAAMRDLLLPKLMSGEVRVKDAQKFVGEAS